jgi:hypothetical protein
MSGEMLPDVIQLWLDEVLFRPTSGKPVLKGRIRV